MKFYDLHIHSAFSGGKSSLEEIARMAKNLGYEGFCFIVYYESDERLEELRKEIEKIEEKFKIQIFLGVEGRSIRELKFLLKKRNEIDLLLARGGRIEINRFACSHPGIDLLTHPSYERRDCGLNHVISKLAVKNKVAIEINFREILISSKKTRAQVMKNFREIIKLHKKYEFYLVANSGAISHWEICDPLVLSSFLNLLGLELKNAKMAVSKVPEEIIKRALEKKGSLRPGIKVIK